MKKAQLWRAFLPLVAVLLLALLVLVVRRKPTKPEIPEKEKVLTLKEIVKHFPFSGENALEEWEEKIFKGHVVYRVEQLRDLSYVRAKSEKAASALYYKMPIKVRKMPLISWKWRVDTFPKKKSEEAIESLKEDDFAARVYVIFPAAFFTNSKVIEYIWAESLEKGASGDSGYSKNIKILALQSGPSRDWRTEKRNIFEDYVSLFGEEPSLDIGAIAFMTDADSTKTAADAVYDEIQIGYDKL